MRPRRDVSRVTHTKEIFKNTYAMDSANEPCFGCTWSCTGSLPGCADAKSGTECNATQLEGACVWAAALKGCAPTPGAAIITALALLLTLIA